jgi:hypothetical protein
MTITEVEKFAKKVEEWTEEEFRSLYGRSLTLEEFCRLYELAQTEEPQQFLQLLEQCLHEIYSGVNTLDLSKFPTERILDRIRNGDHIAGDFYNAISEYQQSKAVDAPLLFILLHLATVMLQIQFRYIGEIASRLLKMPIGLRILQLKAWEDSGIAPVEKDESGNVESYVLKKLLEQLRTATWKLWLPQEAKSHQEEGKDEISHILITTKLNELREFDFDDALLQAISGKIELRHAANFDVIDELHKQTGPMRNPEGGFEYMDAAGERKNEALKLEILANESLQTQPNEEIEEEFTQEQREQLEQLLGETGLKIFEYRYHSEITGHGEKKIIAQALGIAESTVGIYIGTKNRIGIIEANAEKIQKILNIF